MLETLKAFFLNAQPRCLSPPFTHIWLRCVLSGYCLLLKRNWNAFTVSFGNQKTKWLIHNVEVGVLNHALSKSFGSTLVQFAWSWYCDVITLIQYNRNVCVLGGVDLFKNSNFKHLFRGVGCMDRFLRNFLMIWVIGICSILLPEACQAKRSIFGLIFCFVLFSWPYWPYRCQGTLSVPLGSVLLCSNRHSISCLQTNNMLFYCAAAS